MSSGTIGISVDQVVAVGSVPAFRLGTVGRVETDDGTKEYIYGVAGEAMSAAGLACALISNRQAFLLDPAIGAVARGFAVGICQNVLAVGEFGWFQIYGKSSVWTIANTATGAAIYIGAATAGIVDDAPTAGLEHLPGIAVGTTTGGANALNPDCYLSYPSIGLTA